MGEVVAFGRRRIADRGTIHVWPHPDGGYEIGHESASGSSWGHFARFDSAQDAVAAAYRLNREQCDEVCEVYIYPAVLADLPVSPGPVAGDF